MKNPTSGKELLTFLFRTFQLFKPYWVSDEKRTAWLLLLGVLAMEGVQLFVATKLSYATADLFDALDARASDIVLVSIAYWAGYSAALLTIVVLQMHLQFKLIINWRRFLTERYLTGYLDNHLYNQLELGDYNIDNPDQRISMDMLNIAEETLQLGLQFINSFGTLLVFSVILWAVSGTLEFSILGVDLAIPGYMFWAALGFSVFATWAARRIANPLTKLNFRRQAVEAEFRYHLVRVRGNAESIALLEGEKREYDSLSEKFSAIWDNWMLLLKYKRRLIALNFGIGQGANVLPYLVAMPALLAGQIAIGGFMQLSQAFMRVQDSLSWFATHYEQLAVWKASVDRVLSFDDAMSAATAEQASSELIRHKDPGRNFDLKDVTLRLPNGEALIENSNFTFEKGKDVLISGPSGSGKSTLFRLCSGLWVWGRGAVSMPQGQIMFLPQKPYLPIAPLREVLTYPNQDSSFVTTEELLEVMRLCRLDKFAGSLEDTCDWSRILSGGEQQRVSVVRAFLAKPDWLFLDEATASMDPDTEAAIYQALKTHLPGTTLVSIAHRESLRGHHDVEIKLDPSERSLVGMPVPAI